MVCTREERTLPEMDRPVTAGARAVGRCPGPRVPQRLTGFEREESAAMSLPSVTENQRIGHLSARTRLLVRFVDANLHRKLSMDELARSAMISRTHLCRLFKSELGVSPGQYLQGRRMEEAARLLSTTLMSVKQILLEVGYSDKRLFLLHFKKAHGSTPSEYRSTHPGLHGVADSRAEVGKQPTLLRE